MAETKTPVTDHVHECVKLLNEHLQNREVALQEAWPAFGAVFELVDMPWDDHTEDDGLFREGYETCILDIVDAIAQAWGVKLPPVPGVS